MYFRSGKTFFLPVVLFFIFLAVSVSSAQSGEITVITSTEKEVKVNVTPQQTIEDLKKFVFNVTQIHVETQIMTKGDKILDNKRTIESCGIKDGDTLYVKMSVGMSLKNKGAAGKTARTVVIIFLVIGAVYVAKKMFFQKEEKPDIE